MVGYQNGSKASKGKFHFSSRHLTHFTINFYSLAITLALHKLSHRVQAWRSNHQ